MADSGSIKYDVVVVGGGCSGLCAAYRMKRESPNLKILVLEAKARLGGRVCGTLINAVHGKDSWDVGGQWVARSQPNVISLIEELGLETYEQDCDGKKVLVLDNGDVRHYNETGTYGLSVLAAIDVYLGIQKLESLCQMVPIDDPLQCVHAEEWDSKTIEQALNSIFWSSEGKRMLAIAVYVVFGVEASQISFFFFLYFCQQCGGIEQIVDTSRAGYCQEWKVKGGAFQIVEKLADAIGREHIKLNSPVMSITQDASMAKLCLLSGEEFCCNRMIIAIPPNFKAKIHYTPDLPGEQRNLLERMPIGHLTKIILTYSKRFWKEKNLSGEAAHWPLYIGSEAYPVCVTFDATSSQGSPALVLFVGGKRALDLGKLKEEAQRNSIINSLVLFFGDAAAHPIDMKIKDWSKEPWNGGCPVSVMAPGGLTTYGVKALREPFQRIHWAGTETAKYWSGYIDGAIQSGFRAADEVLADLCTGFIPDEGYAFDRVNEQQLVELENNENYRIAVIKYLLLFGASIVLGSFLERRLRTLWR